MDQRTAEETFFADRYDAFMGRKRACRKCAPWCTCTARKVLPENDGYPEAWITPDGKTGPTYDAARVTIRMIRQRQRLWYHDHAMGITRLNVVAGLAGAYVIRDDEEEALNLPSGDYEMPLLIQDRSFLADGSLWYPPAPKGTHPMWMQEYFGETICVNGKATPYLEVEPRKYRFRMVNGSNSRFYHLTLVPADKSGKPTGQPVDAPAFRQIGTDAGLLPQPLSSHYLIFSPGERFRCGDRLQRARWMRVLR